MARLRNVRRPARLQLFLFLVFIVSFASVEKILAQSSRENALYIRRNTLGVFGAYSPNSSHMLLGDARNRELLNIGVVYNRRLLAGRVVNWQYSGELLPVALESDPQISVAYTMTYTNPSLTVSGVDTESTVAPCQPFSGSFTLTNGNSTVTENYVATCTRRWTIGEGMSPVGMQWNFLPFHKLQPFAVGHGGYMYSTQPIPVIGAGSFNFTFDIGAGVELYRSPSRSIRAEYRYHHISNHETASMNPGIDNGVIQVTYCFRLGHQ